MEVRVNEIQIDFIRELFNVGVNESTNLLSSILNVEIHLTVPEVKIIEPDNLMIEMEHLGSPLLAAVNMGFQNDFSGLSQLVFTQDNANKLVQLFTRDILESNEIDEMKSGALIEIGNILLNAVMSVFSNTFKHEFDFHIPEFFENYKIDFFNKIDSYIDNVVLLGQTIFTIDEFEISGNTVIFLNIASFKQFIKMIDEHFQQHYAGI